MRTPGFDPVKEFLYSAIEARIDVKRHKRRVQELDAQCARLTANMSGMPRGGGDDHSHEAMWNALADAREQELLAMKRAEEQKQTVDLFITHIPKSQHRSVLKLRYVEGMSWTRMQFALCDEGVYYSDRHIRRIHDKALDVARELWAAGGPWEEALTESEE
jgi:DNA-directed RNA polymerase specialized sigma24 family protein